MSSFLVVFQEFYKYFRQCSWFQFSVKFHSYFAEHIPLTTSVTANFIHISIAPLDPIGHAITLNTDSGMS